MIYVNVLFSLLNCSLQIEVWSCFDISIICLKFYCNSIYLSLASHIFLLSMLFMYIVYSSYLFNTFYYNAYVYLSIIHWCECLQNVQCPGASRRPSTASRAAPRMCSSQQLCLPFDSNHPSTYPPSSVTGRIE